MGMKSFSGGMNRIGIDLGSSQVRMYAENKIVLAEPSAAAIELSDGQPTAFGVNALVRYHGEPDRYRLEWPVKHGAIADYYLTKDMLQYFLEKAMHRSVSRPAVALSIPSGTSSVVRHALVDAAIHAGARQAYLISSPAAAALGARMKLSFPEAALSMVIGRDVCDCGLFTCGGVVAEGAVPFGGHTIDEGIRGYMLETYRMMIGSQEAEEIKMEMATVVETREPRTVNVRGRRADDGVEVVLELTSAELAPVMRRILLPVVSLLKKIIRAAEPEMAGDFLKNGMILSGGSALLAGISDWIASEIGIPVLVPEDAGDVVAAGCYAALDEYRRLPGIIENGEVYYGGN